MSKLVSLLRATMSGGPQLFNYRGKTERSRRIMPFVLTALFGVMMLFSALAMMAELKEEGAELAILPLYTLITSAIIVMEGAYKAGDLLFKPRDNDMLLAMPIKKSTIVLARLVKFYVFEMLYCLIFLLPAVIAYAINVEVGVSFYLVALTMLILVPVIPIAISCIVGLVVSGAASRFKHKALLQVVLSFGFLFVIVALFLAVNMSSDFGGRSLVAISNRVSEFYYPAATFMGLAKHFEVGQYAIFVMVNLAVLLATVLAISRFYFQIVSRMAVKKRHDSMVHDGEYVYRRHSQTFAIVKKELTKYFNTPVLLINTAIGLVFFIVAVGGLCFKFDEVANSLIGSVEGFPLTVNEMRSYLPSVTFGMIAFASLLTCITATMISLEGRAFNLLKSLPISGRKVIMAKVLAAMLLIVPVTLLGCVVMCLRFQFGILEILLLLVAVVAIPLVTELIGILINLRYARFDAESDAVVVRQSASVMVATFLGLGMVLFTISLTFAVVFFTGQIVGLLIMDAVFVIVALFLCFVVATKGDEKYMKLMA